MVQRNRGIRIQFIEFLVNEFDAFLKFHISEKRKPGSINKIDPGLARNFFTFDNLRLLPSHRLQFL